MPLDHGVVELPAPCHPGAHRRHLGARPERALVAATSFDGKPHEVASFYGRRIAVDEQMRDAKGCRYGVEIFRTAFGEPERIARMFILVGVALVVWTAHGHEIAKSDPTARLPHPRKGPRRSLANIGRHAARAALRVLLTSTRWLKRHLPRPNFATSITDFAPSDPGAQRCPGRRVTSDK